MATVYLSSSLVTVTIIASAKVLVDSALDAALVKFSIYSVILLTALALVIIAVIWFVYNQYLNPLAQKLDALVGAPEHFDSMSRHMQQTSDNLLALQGGSASPRRATHLSAR